MTLAELIATKPGSKSLSDVKAWLEEMVTVPNPERIDSVTCMARLSIEDSRTLFATLKTVAAQDALVAEALIQLQGKGIDLSHTNAKAMIDALFAPELASKVKALGEKIEPRYMQAGIGRLKDGYILEAL